jgi:hypothetical protein
MQITQFVSNARHWIMRVLVIAILLALGAPMTRQTALALVTQPSLMQFTSGGHVIGFAPTQVILASLDHALRIEFAGTDGVTPVAVNMDEASSRDGMMIRPAELLGTVTYSELWRGVSVEYRTSDAGILKSTYTIAPGASAAQIRLHYNVPVELQSDGSLQFPFGRGYISESAPIAWQEIDGARVLVPVAFRVFETADANLQSEIENRKSEIGFQLGAYDARYPLTIDPNYFWHTFYGSTTNDYSRAIAVDGSNNIYIVGHSTSTWGSPLHTASNCIFSDIVVLKLNSAGAYQWHTFYGGGGSDHGNAIAVDGSGNIYVAGESNVTWQGDGGVNPLKRHSGQYDIVVLKLNSAGAYQWHTFYGSGNNDYNRAIAVDGSSNVYIVGFSLTTWTGDGNAQPLHAHSGGSDIAVLKLNSAGAYQWHTFYGSAGHDVGRGIAADGNNNVYITGSSYATWGSPLHAYGGNDDIVVLKLNSAGTYQWHTFYGEAGADYGYAIAVDGSGNVYIAGESGTWQGDGGTNPLHPHSGYVDIVVLKLNNAGAYQWHTFYGSTTYYDWGSAITLDASSNIYIAGGSSTTWQGDGGTDPFHTHSGGFNIVALKLNSTGMYQWHTFYGPTNEDKGDAIAVDGNGNVYLAGESSATWQGAGGVNPLHAFSGPSDIVVLKLGSTPMAVTLSSFAARAPSFDLFAWFAHILGLTM